MEATIQVQSTVAQCKSFMRDGKNEEVTIIISPLRVEEKDDKIIMVVSGCSMWKECQNKGCQFSLAARPAKK